MFSRHPVQAAQLHCPHLCFASPSTTAHSCSRVSGAGFTFAACSSAAQGPSASERLLYRSRSEVSISAPSVLASALHKNSIALCTAALFLYQPFFFFFISTAGWDSSFKIVWYVCQRSSPLAWVRRFGVYWLQPIIPAVFFLQFKVSRWPKWLKNLSPTVTWLKLAAFCEEFRFLMLEQDERARVQEARDSFPQY